MAQTTAIEALETKVGTGSSVAASGQVLTASGTGSSTWAPVSLSSMATGVLPVVNGGTGVTTSTGTGSTVLSNSPTLVTPALGTPASGVATNLTGTASGLTAGNVTTNANLTGPITSSGNTTSIASQTGTGSKFVVDTSPTLVTPNLGTPSAAVLTHATGLPYGGLLSTIFSGQVTSAANAGTAGGTINYVNLGGIKLLWGISASGLSSGAAYTWTLPASFFSTLQSVIPGTYIPSGVVSQYQIVQTASTTSISLYNVASTGSGTTQQSLIVIGT